MVTKNYFTEQQYNNILVKFKFKRDDLAQKPEKINTASKKCRGKAMSIGTHLRYFGLLISHLDLPGTVFSEKVYKLYTLLVRIYEVLMSPESA